MRAARELDPHERLNIINGAKYAPLTRRAKVRAKVRQQPEHYSDAELAGFLEWFGLQRVLAVIAAKQQAQEAA
jgi:hypothetical protein